jgi:hypothetical protein
MHGAGFEKKGRMKMGWRDDKLNVGDASDEWYLRRLNRKNPWVWRIRTVVSAVR